MDITCTGTGFPAGGCLTGFDAFTGVFSVFFLPENMIIRFSLTNMFSSHVYVNVRLHAPKEIGSETPKSWDFHSFAGLGFCFCWRGKNGLRGCSS